MTLHGVKLCWFLGEKIRKPRKKIILGANHKMSKKRTGEKEKMEGLKNAYQMCLDYTSDDPRE